MRHLLLLVFPLLAWSQPTNLRLIGATATSLHVGYTAPTTGACTFAVTTATPGVVNDLSTALRAGANSDAFVVYGSQTRAILGAGVAGPREAIIGFRSMILVAGRTHSLALQADIYHTVIVTCPGGSQTVSRHTAKIAGVAPQSAQFLAGAHGNFGAPDFDWTDRTKPVIGVNGEAIYRISDPSDFGFQLNESFPRAFNGTSWANLQNVISFGGAGATTNNTNAVFVPLMVEGTSYAFGGFASDYWYRMSNLALRVYGAGDNATSANRTIRACFTANGQTCYTGYKSVILPLTTAAEVPLVDYHSEFPTAGFAGWDKPFPGDTLMMRGRVTATGTGVLTLVAGPDGGGFVYNGNISVSWFRPNMVGSRIFVAGSDPTCPENYCTVASYQSSTQITTVQLPTVTSAVYNSAGSGFLVEKTTATGSITFSLGYRTATYNPVHQGQNPSCSPAVIPGTRAARLCLFARNRDYFGTAYVVDPDSKESRPISLISVPASIAGHAAGDLPTGAGFRLFNAGATPTFHSTDPGSFYVLWSTVGGSAALFRVACNLATTPAGLAWSYSAVGAVAGYVDPCIWTNLTKSSESRGLQTQLSPGWDESKYGSLASGMELKGATNGRIVLSKGMAGQDLPCGVFVLDSEGTYQRRLNTLNGVAGARFTGCHAVSTAAGKAIISFNRLADFSPNYFGGPFVNVVASVKKSGVFNANTSLPTTVDGSYDATCPVDLAVEWQTLGATGNNCVTIRITGQPCSAFASASERAAHPCPSDVNKSYIGANLAPGDTGDNGTSDSASYTVVKVTDIGDLELVLLADSATGYRCQSNNPRGRTCAGAPSQFAQINGWSIQWQPRSQEYAYDVLTGEVTHENEWLTRGHPDRTESGLYLGIMGFGEFYFARQGGTIGSPQTATFNRSGNYAGSTLPNIDNQQSYISAQPVASTGIANVVGSDFPHYNGGTGITPEAFAQQIGSTMTFSLQPGTTSVYKILPISNTYDANRGQIESWVGASVNGEKSSPTTGSHTLTDADAGRGCFALRAGECRIDSSANDYFAVIPNLDLAKTRCHASQITYPSACVLASVSTQAHVVQMRLGDDPQGRQQRIVSDSSTRPGSQYVYTHARQFPDSICILSTVHHLAGWFTGPVLICPGGWPEDAVNRTTYTPFFVSVPANSIVEFGLDPQFRCKYNAGSTAGRDEACKVSAATIVEATPFRFSHETLTATAGLQNVQMPFQSGHVYYYRVVTAGLNGPVQVRAIP